MGWGLIIGAAGLAIALYELWTRPTAKELVNNAAAALKQDAGAAAAKANALAGLSPQPNDRVASRAEQCKLELLDWAKTEAWSKDAAPTLAGLPLVPRMKLMPNVIPMFTWPMHARRVYCTYVEGQ